MRERDDWRRKKRQVKSGLTSGSRKQHVSRSQRRGGQPAEIALRRHVAEALHPSAGEDIMFITGGKSSAPLED